MDKQQINSIRHRNVCDRLNKLYELKNRKYGDSFNETFDKYGGVALCLRLNDKLKRLEQILLHGEAGTADESVIDTLEDLANYAILGILKIEEGE